MSYRHNFLVNKRRLFACTFLALNAMADSTFESQLIQSDMILTSQVMIKASLFTINHSHVPRQTGTDFIKVCSQ